MNKNGILRSTILSIICLTFLYNTSWALQLFSKRLWGNDRYKTAVAISQYGWEKSEYVVLARGDDFADALCAGPLAKKYDAPILLTEPEFLDYDIVQELIRLQVDNVIIIGGPGAVSYDVENSLKSFGIMKVMRIWGEDRYETAVKIAEELGTSLRVALASGNDFPDALSISPIASSLDMPILLTGKDGLPDSVREYLDRQSINCTYIIGGTGVIGINIEGLVPNPVRLGGSDRYETNARVIEEFEGQLDFSSLYVAVGDGVRGNEFADALSGAVLAAKSFSPVILVHRSLADVTGKFLKLRVASLGRVIALGGESAVPERVVEEILSYGNEAEEDMETSSIDESPSYTEENPVKVSWYEDGSDVGEKTLTAAAGDIVDIVFYARKNNRFTGTLESLKFVVKWIPVNGSSANDINIVEGAAGPDSGVYFVLGNPSILTDNECTPFTVRVRFHKAGRYRLAIHAVN